MVGVGMPVPTAVATVRRHAAWALGRLGGDEARTTLQHALRTETDAPTRQEIKSALTTTKSNA